jgi:tRNA/rRNA methyltransferase
VWKLNSAKEKILKNIEIILVEPQVPENIGLVARVLKNTAITNLPLVNPNLNKKSFEVAKRAQDILRNAKVFKTTEEAIAESCVVFGTTRRKREYKFIYNFNDIKHLLISFAIKGKVGILFGKENFGLSRKDLELCDGVFTLEANPKFPSYNLAICCGIVCYELMNLLNVLYQFDELKPACKKDIESLFLYLKRYLSSYLDKNKKDSVFLSLRRILTRTYLTKNEVSLLKSIILKMEKK